jgi:HK97 gp10 family phage protein
MVGVVTFKIIGGENLEKKLRQLGPEIAGKIGHNSLTAGANYLAREIRKRAPVETGRLKKSIRSQKVNLGGSASTITRIIGFVKPGRYYAHLVEFGTRHSAAHPFIRPALDAGHSRGILEMGRALWRGIEQYALGQILTTLDQDDKE